MVGTLYWEGWFLVYGALAMVATFLVRKDRPRLEIALVLLASWAVTNLAYFGLAQDVRPALQVMFDVGIGAAAVAAKKLRPGLDARIIVGLALASALATFAYSWKHPPIFIWEVAVNVIFALQCITLGARGAGNVVNSATHSFRRRSALAWSGVDSVDRLAGKDR